MSGPTEFTLESVRQYMLMRDGRVTNHELVKYFKAFLTHPTEKEISRQKFKEYVNTLATIRQENGEKYLVLKKKFYPHFEEEETSLLDEVMAGLSHKRMLPPTPTNNPNPHYGVPHRSQPPVPQDLGLPTNPQANYYPPSSQRSSYASNSSSSSNLIYRSNSNGSPSSDPSHRAPLPPYRPPPPSGYHRQLPPPPPPPHGHVQSGLPNESVPPPLPRRNGDGAPRYSRSSSSSLQGVAAPPPHPYPNVGLPNPSMHNMGPGPQSVGLPNQAMKGPSNSQPIPPMSGPQTSSHGYISPPHGYGSMVPTSSSRSSLSSLGPPMSLQAPVDRPPPPPPKSESPLSPPPPLPNRNPPSSNPSLSRQTSSNEEKENETELEKISVKERTKTFNRMASEVDMRQVETPGRSVSQSSSRKSSANAIKRKNSRAADRRRASSREDNSGKSDDSSSISTIDQSSKLWMIKSAQGDYHAMMKMLKDDHRLAKHRDFTSGFTAIHWAAKHGNLDMVKLLAGTHKVPVNVKSHGGYTPLHLACQFGHQDVFDLLVKAYGSDPRIRDNHGKTPRQYMMTQEQSLGNLSLSSDTFRQLKDRRRNRTNRQEAEKNPGILRFGSLSVKVKKTTEAWNNYFGSERKTSWGSTTSSTPADDLISLPSRKTSMASNASVESVNSDIDRMPPPKFGPIKKRKSKRSASDFGLGKSAPTTPTEERIPIKEMGGGVKSDDSDSEYGFDSGWGMPRI